MLDLQEFIRLSLEEDFGSGDHTSLSCIPPDSKGSAELLVKSDGILAGVDIAESIFRQYDADIKFEKLLDDGAVMQKGMLAFKVHGSVHTLLGCERLALNCMQRMSGIATLTRAFVEKASPFGATILDTRKTTPLMRSLEKLAVRIGGGQNHRMGLYDMILIKDNHVDFAGSITNAINRAVEYKKAHGLNIPIEVETRNMNEVHEVLQNGQINRIMFDNFSPELMRQAVKEIDGRYETEASGGINIHNVSEYAATGIQFISVGALTHSAVSLDLSLKASRN
ncbi:MAG: carboxylating nicotinate-nucleotide diphosphorylase [Bacteroidota bacterium]